jgi:hypothetical protein
MAGTVTETNRRIGSYTSNPNLVNSMTLSWTSDSSGDATATTGAIFGTILRVATNPGATAPTDNYDVTLSDADGFDILYGLGANRDTANTESISPVDPVSGVPPVVAGPLSLSVSSAGASKVGTVVIYYR